MDQLSIRLEDEQIKQLDKLAEANGCTRSEQVRTGLEKYLGICEKVEQGNFIVSLPSITPDEVELINGDFDQLLEDLDGMADSEYLIKVLSIVKDALTFDAAIKLVEQQPEELLHLSTAYISSDTYADLAAMNYHDYKNHGTPYRGV